MKYSDEIELIKNILKNKKILITGLTGTGKSRFMKKISKLFSGVHYYEFDIDNSAYNLKNKVICIDDMHCADVIDDINKNNIIIATTQMNYSINSTNINYTQLINTKLSYKFDYILKIDKFKNKYFYLSEIKNRYINNNFNYYKISNDINFLNCMRLDKMKKLL